MYYEFKFWPMIATSTPSNVYGNFKLQARETQDPISNVVRDNIPSSLKQKLCFFRNTS